MTTKVAFPLGFRAIGGLLILLLTLLATKDLHSQNESFFTPADTLNKARFYTGLGVGVGSFTATSIGLYNTWYKDFEQSEFHFFNDWKEWQGMDKLGHAYTAYNLCQVGYHGARWTGISKNNALWFVGIGSSVIQSTIEIMDGYSTKWGFSVGDVLFNTLGTGSFIVQQSIWDDQRIRLKISSSGKNYSDQILTNPNSELTIQDRAFELYGHSSLERFLKDYNSQTIWLSINPKSFAPSMPFPKWLNIALGYGAENMFGGFENSWDVKGVQHEVADATHPRYKQFFLSLDVDLQKIESNNHFLNMLLIIANGYKLPAPTLEYNILGEWRFHLLFSR